MRLKRIEMAGFKSFVDPTKIEFGEGVTAIVGPNGSGKSNIVDALRWVLGEHSAKHLRGGVMEDLIFQGSDTRPPVAVCDVELTFSVEPGSLPSPYHEMDQIRIRRRLTRDGGSDAFINGRMVRLKDVVDLFLDTGVSNRAYAIIEQGMIARMIMAKPEERRILFEEAAGVMKYRARRRESERRMQDTRQNLERVMDLLEEVRSRCRSLKQQALRAERFRTMQDEFSRLRAIGLALRYRAMQEKLSAIESRVREARGAEDAAQAALHAAEKKVAEVRARLEAHEIEAQQAQDRLREAEQQRAALQQHAERLAGERRLLRERCQGLRQRLEDAEKGLQRLDAEIATIEKQLEERNDADFQAAKREAEAACARAERRYRDQVFERDEALAAYERLRLRAAQAEQQRNKAEAALNRLQERLRRLQHQKRELQEALAENAKQAEQAEEQWAAAKEAGRQAADALEQAQARLEACRDEREQAAAALAAREAELRELRGRAQELRGRTRNQDVPEDLREAMRAKGAVWMDESLDVPKGLEAAVAAALRGRSADVRIPVNPDLRPWRELLARSSDAPVALFAGRSAAQARPRRSLAEALGLSEEHPLFDVFARVGLVEDIVDAYGSEYCCVSRDGWRYEADGWLIPPAGNRTAIRLALQRRLREYEAELARLDASVTEARQRLAAAEKALEAQQQHWRTAHLAAAQAEAEIHSAEAARKRLQSERQALRERSQRVDTDIQEIQQECEHWRMQLTQSDTVDPEKLQLAREALETINARVAEYEQARERCRSQLAQAEQALALFLQARKTMQRDGERLRAEQQRLRSQKQKDEDALRRFEAELQQISRNQGVDAQLAQAAQTVDAAHQRLNHLRQQGHQLQQQLHEMEREEREARRRCQQAAERRQAAQVTLAQEATRLQDLEDEIRQRCQSSPAELWAQIGDAAELEDSETILKRARELEERIARFGAVNLLAIEEYEQAAEREAFLAGQAADLEKSLATLNETIARIDRTTRQRFKEAFEKVNAIFQQTFPRLFGGGRAELRLDSEDILTAGVEVIAQPPGKRLQDISLLSGGEKALTAVALVFSIFQFKPAPFCVLDEVDAPLDDANAARFGELVRELADRIQFLAITHNHITMQMADRLIGVSMPEPGVSRIVAVDIEKLTH